MAIKLTSPGFSEGDRIPERYTVDGIDVSPELRWDAVPKSTKSLAVLCEDPDAPFGTWTHWVLFDLSPTLRSLPENQPPMKVLDSGAKHGLNDFQNIGYGGPNPPTGEHRYYFKLYALDCMLEDLDAGATRQKFLKEIQGHILDQGQLMGRYSRK